VTKEGRLNGYLAGLAAWQRGVVAAILNTCVWTLAYFLFLRAPLPAGWSVRDAMHACLAFGCVGGVLGCATSRRLSPIAVGAAAGIILGGAEAAWSDISMSYWQRVTSGLVVAPFPLYLWFSIVGTWMLASIALGRWEFGRAAIRTAAERRARRRTTRCS
jgi:hypothetical protein